MTETGPVTPRPSLDAHIGLALGMTARPGVTAVLSGAGLSVGAGVPAAWEVQQELLGRAAVAAGETPEDVFAWWRERTGKDASYDDVLFATGSTRLARKDLLRPFFEPTDGERATGIKVPSDGHRALAKLMRDGLIRIIVTLNFDLLIETALRDLGVEPTVVSTPDDVRGMEPLHAQTNLVWHLHGDYTNPEMLNTPDELRAYDPTVDARLDELFDQYGLLIVGWSATWDPALRAALARCSSRRYPTTWLGRGALSDEASRLVTQRDATVVADTADEWLARLEEACRAVRERTRDPLTTVASVGALKREITVNPRSIAAHDRLQKEIERVTRLGVMDTSHTAFQSMTYAERIARVEAELEQWASFVGVMAYWGTVESDQWWSRYIEQFGATPALSGGTDVIELFTAPAVVTLFAGGAAAAAGDRWELVCDLISDHLVRDLFQGGRAQTSALVGPSKMYPGNPWPSRRLASYLGPILSDNVGLGSIVALQGWERFEYVLWLANVDRNLRNERYSLAFPTPYVRVDDDRSGGRRETSPLVSAWLREHPEVRVVILDSLFDGDQMRFDAAISDGDDAISRAVSQSEDRDLMRRGGAGWMPSGVRRAMFPRDSDRHWPEE